MVFFYICVFYFVLCIEIHFSEKGAVGFARLSKGSMAQKRLRTPSLFEGSQASPTCPSDVSSVKMKMGAERWWSDNDRGN